MYQVIGITKTLGIFATTCVLVFLVMYYKEIPALVQGPLIELRRPITSAVTFGSGVFWLLGQTPLFVWLCKAPLVRKYLPPIDGEWDMQLKSNWGIKQKWLGLGDGDSLITVPGKVKIKARLFSIKMEFVSADGYSESKTISVSVRPSDQTGLLELNYMFVNFTQIPVATDTNTHTGAARVFVKELGDQLYMEGTYFTDRKWTEGLNTAGQVTFTRPKVA